MIYPDRPQACQVYQCAWLIGHFDEDMRPDKCGLLCEVAAFGDEDGLQDVTLLLGEIWDRELAEEHTWKAAKAADFSTVVVITTKGRDQDADRVYGGAKGLYAWMSFLQSCRNGHGGVKMADSGVIPIRV